MFESEEQKTPGSPDDEQVYKAKSRKFFAAFVRRHPKAWEILREFNLVPKGAATKQYEKVSRHSVTEAAVADALAEKLNISPEGRERLVEAIFLHDAYKRERVEMNDPYQSGRDPKEKFWDSNSRQGTEVLRKMGVEPEVIDVISAIDVAGMVKLNFEETEDETELIKKIAWYIDSITLDTSLVKLEERVKRFRAREPETNDYGLEIVGMPTFDYYEHAAQKLEPEIVKRLGIEKPDSLPEVLKDLLRKKIEQVSD